MKCYEHNHAEAQGMCVKCGKPICENCIVEVGGKYQCRRCLRVYGNTNEVRPITVNNTNTNNSKSSFEEFIGFCFCMIILAAIFGYY